MKSTKVIIGDPAKLIKFEIFGEKIDFDNLTIDNFNEAALLLLEKHHQDEKIYLFVDELVISKMNTRSDEYTLKISIIKDLIKSIARLNDIFTSKKIDINLIASLRTSVRNAILNIDGEMSKIIDGCSSVLHWNKHSGDGSIENVLINKIRHGGKYLQQKEDAERILFESINFGRKKLSRWSFLSQNTWLRPRDAIRLLHACKIADGSATEIGEKTIKAALNEYSRTSAIDVFDEISATIEKSYISKVRSNIKSYNYHNLEDFSRKTNVDVNFEYAEAMFQAGILGNYVPRDGRYYWYYRDEENFDPDKNIVIHDGLRNYFNIR